MATVVCSQDHKSFLLSLTLMKNLTSCFHPYYFSLVFLSSLLLSKSYSNKWRFFGVIILIYITVSLLCKSTFIPALTPFLNL